MKLPISLVVALFAATVPAHAQAPAPAAPPGDTRLFLMPTGRTLDGSSGYVDVISFGVAQFQAGLTDRFSIGAGTPPILVDTGRPVWITPKVAVVRAAALAAAVGAVHVLSPDGSGGVGYGVATFGAKRTAVSVGVMQGYGNYLSEVRGLIVGVEEQRSEHTRFMMEASIFRAGSLVVIGVRRAGKSFTSDFGMAIPVARDFPLVAFPVFNFGWRF